VSFSLPRPALLARAVVLAAAACGVVACEIFFQPKESSAVDDAGGGQGEGGPAGDGSAGTESGSSGGQSTPPSCKGSASATLCGPAKNQDCCASSVVPATKMFKRSYDGVSHADGSHLANISKLQLDVYEVTVGRFRKFVDALPGSRPMMSARGLPLVAGDPGWSDPQGKVALSAPDLATKLQTCTGARTWTPDAGPNETLPMNCVPWAEAYAFCIWDGGRLPTEAEWNLAAAGGLEQRVYPWSVPPNASTIGADNAVFSTGGPASVGSKSPAGDGKWLHADLAGNLAEWTLDWFFQTYQELECDDCAELTMPQGERAVRGGAFSDNPGDSPDRLFAAERWHHDPLNRFQDVGVRCARPAP
jgi:sulfatase modifying factor 1